MRDPAILIPVCLLAAWTGLMLVLVAARRIASGLSPKEFALGESSLVPGPVSLINRNYMNLLELPVLFYVACVLAYVAPVTVTHAAAWAWAYVVLRIVHSLIHITYNRVMHRFFAFGLSNVALIGLWVVVLTAVFGAKTPG